MSFARVRRALETALNTWAAAQSPAIAVAWENSAFQAGTAAYLMSFMLPQLNRSESIDQKHRRYSGIFQVSIYAPINNGPADATAIADALDSVFTTSAPLTNGGLAVFITTPLSVGPARQEPGWYVLPVSVGYRADVML